MMGNKSFLGSFSVATKSLLNFAFIGMVIIAQMVLYYYSEHVIKYNYNTMRMQEETLLGSRADIGYKALEIKLLYKIYVRTFYARDLYNEGQEIGVALKDIEDISAKHFSRVDNAIGSISSEIIGIIHNIRGDILNLNNKKVLTNKDKINGLKLDVNYGIDNLLSSYGNKALVELYANIVRAENDFMALNSTKAFEEVTSTYSLLKAAINTQMNGTKLQTDLMERLAIRYNNFKVVADSTIDVGDLHAQVKEHITKLLSLDQKLYQAINEKYESNIRDIQNYQDFIRLIINALYIINILQIILSYIFYRETIIKPLEVLSEFPIKFIKSKIINIPYLDNEDEIGKIANALQEFAGVYETKKGNELKFLVNRERAEETRQIDIADLSVKFNEEIHTSILSIIAEVNTLYNISKKIDGSININTTILNQVINSTKAGNQKIQNIALATKELSTSIKGIATQSTNSTNTFKIIIERADLADAHINNLAKSVETINSIAKMLSNMSEQMNLLALNVTIDSARTSVTPKGSGIANEIKGLAQEAIKLREQIYEQIENMQIISSEVVQSLKDIKASIHNSNQNTRSIALTVEDQNDITDKITGNINNASVITNNMKDSMLLIHKRAEDTKLGSNELLGRSQALKDKLDSLHSLTSKGIFGVKQ